MTYREFFEDRIGQHLRNSIIVTHSSQSQTHTYTPYSHPFLPDAEERLAELMKQYIFLYAYSSDEVLEANEEERLNDLIVAAKRAIRERLPDRTGPTSGLWGELLLHLLFEIDTDASERLATRTIYRQMTDNQEIKGFDGMQIKFSDNGIELWLGQSKMGARTYCYNGIEDDLNDKSNILYTSKQLYFVADKETKVSDRAKSFLKSINRVSWEAEGLEQDERAEKLEDFFVAEEITLVLPCVMAFGRENIYDDPSQINSKLQDEITYAISKFDSKFANLFARVPYKIQIWIIPIRDLTKLRDSLQQNLS